MGVLPTMIVYRDPFTDKNSVIKVSESDVSAQADVKQALYLKDKFMISGTVTVHCVYIRVLQCATCWSGKMPNDIYLTQASV